MNWRLAHSLEVLRDEVNTAWPQRSKAADGTIGDVAHQNQGSASDHNPWIIDSNGVPVVRAFDITADGIPAADVAERIRKLGEAGDPRLADHGYVIFNYRIASYSNWQWHPETGDPHTSHIHVSVSRNQPGYDDVRSWGITAAPYTPVPNPEDDMFTQDDSNRLRNVEDLLGGQQGVRNKVDNLATEVKNNVEGGPAELKAVAAVQTALKQVFGVPADATLDQLRDAIVKAVGGR